MNPLKSRRISCPLPPLPSKFASKTGVLRPLCAQVFPKGQTLVGARGGLRCLTEIRYARGNGSNAIARSGLLAAASSDASRRLAKRPNRLRRVLAAHGPMVAMGAGGLTVFVAATYKKDWRWWVVGIEFAGKSISPADSVDLVPSLRSQTQPGGRVLCPRCAQDWGKEVA